MQKKLRIRQRRNHTLYHFYDGIPLIIENLKGKVFFLVLNVA